jgi:MFS family permease
VRAQIGTLIIATSVIQLANGFFGTFISLRVATEDFGATLAGLVLSSYFAGFTLGAGRCGQIIERVGHIRAYASFAGPVVAATAAMPLLIGPLPWFVLRAIVGFGCAGDLLRPRAGSMPRRSHRSGSRLLALHGRHLPGSRGGPAPDQPD